MQRAGIRLPESNTAWACNALEQRGFLPGGAKYFKHGYGCAVHLDNAVVDFDFGDKGQVNGFDVWRLTRFAEGNLPAYGFESVEALKSSFDRAKLDGAILDSGYILHYLGSRV